MDLSSFHSSPAESFAQANGLIQAFLAWLLWRETRMLQTRGLGWLALGMFGAAIFNLMAPLSIAPNIGLHRAAPVSLAFGLLGFVTMAALVVGLLSYCAGTQARWLLIFVGLWLGLPLLTAALVFVGVPYAGILVALGVFSFLAHVAWKTESLYPATGHQYLALALLSYPAAFILLHVLGVDPQNVRYLVAAPYTLIGVFLFYVALNRQTAERALVARELVQLNAHLEDRVRERTQAVEHNLAQLQRTQAQLVQTEKLAALGRLVAGVAHELNTPLGNVLVTATTLNERAAEVVASNRSGTLRRSQLASFLEGALDATGLMERNTQRAVELVTTFKRVSVDQASSHRRTFKLNQAVEDTLRMLEPTLKKLPVQCDMQIPPDVELDSFPGPLEQVVANLVQNAALHGLGARAALHVHIAAQREDREVPGVIVEVSDDGDGMPADVVKQVFDPFFSTRFGQGGSGLGLYIVHGLVTGLLGGAIVVWSEPGQGARFTLWIPLLAPAGSK